MKSYYDALYRENEHYWGRLPSPLSLLVLSREHPKTLLELGCGQGPDAIYFASKGVEVTATDIVPSAIDALQKEAARLGLPIKALVADMHTSFSAPGAASPAAFDAVFSRMAVQTLPAGEREQFLEDLKRAYPDAVHAHVIPISGACFGDAFICPDDLLKEAYKDWTVLFYEEAWTIGRVPNRNGEPFLMREARIIARKPAARQGPR